MCSPFKNMLQNTNLLVQHIKVPRVQAATAKVPVGSRLR